MPLVSPHPLEFPAAGPADSGSTIRVSNFIANPKLAPLAHGNFPYFPCFPDSLSPGSAYRPTSSRTSVSASDSDSTALSSSHSFLSSVVASSPMASQDPDSVKQEASQYDGSSGSESKQSSGDAAAARRQASAPGYTQPRKRASRAGTRSVTTLSAAQLERKRANDREAQRAIRARTKEHIDKLERRLHELTSGSHQNEQLMASVKRNRELEEENAVLRAKLQQAHYSLGIPADSQDAGWNAPSMMRTTMPNGGLTVMSQPQLQQGAPPPTRHDSATPHFGSWQDPSNTFGPPSSIRRTVPTQPAFQADIASLGNAGAPRRENISPNLVTPISASSAAPSSQGVEYTYRPGLAPQYGAIPDPTSQQINRDGGMGGMHMGQPNMANYGAPPQQQQQQHGPPSVQQQQPRFMPYNPASPAGQQSHSQQQQQQQQQQQSQQQQQQQQGPDATASFTAQNQQHHAQQHHAQQPQQGMYYSHATYAH